MVIVISNQIFTQLLRGDTRGHRFKIHVCTYHTFLLSMDGRKRSFSYRCVTVWNRLLDSVIDSTDLKTFKAPLSHAIPI